MLSDAKLRQKYDKLRFGDSATSTTFKNEDAYLYWSQKQFKTRQAEFEEVASKVEKEFETYGGFASHFEQAETEAMGGQFIDGLWSKQETEKYAQADRLGQL